MFTLDCMEWTDHALGGGAKQARHTFANGYTLSVVYGPHLYGDGEDTFEAAIIVDAAKGKLLDLSPYGWDDTVAAWAEREEIGALADAIALLPARTGSAE